MVHKNQYGFLKTRTIQDFLAWSFKDLHMSHESKKKRIVNPKINHDVMLQNMRAKGFGETLLSWMRKIFESGTSTMLLNGV